MSGFGKRDVTEILELLENELDAVPRLEKVEKMKLRAKIRHHENWLLTLENPKPAKIVLRLQGRLAEIFRLYPSSFKDKLADIEDKCSKLDRSSRSDQRCQKSRTPRPFEKGRCEPFR
jgi:hypothetical protein